jgi:hypothetical protein
MNPRVVIDQLRLAPIAALAMLLTACSGGPQPLGTTLCDLPLYPQRLLQLDAQVGAERDGRAVIVDARCPAIRIELRLTGAAARAGFDERLKKASAGLSDPASVRLPVKLTGVYTGPPDGSYFTAEAVVELTAGKT